MDKCVVVFIMAHIVVSVQSRPALFSWALGLHLHAEKNLISAKVNTQSAIESVMGELLQWRGIPPAPPEKKGTAKTHTSLHDDGFHPIGRVKVNGHDARTAWDHQDRDADLPPPFSACYFFPPDISVKFQVLSKPSCSFYPSYKRFSRSVFRRPDPRNIPFIFTGRMSVSAAETATPTCSPSLEIRPHHISTPASSVWFVVYLFFLSAIFMRNCAPVLPLVYAVYCCQVAMSVFVLRSLSYY